jgi:hypothetical protein
VSDNKPIADNFTFLLGAVRYKDLFYFALQDDRVDINHEPHFNPVTLDRGEWGGNKIIQWTPVDLTVCRSPLEQMVAMSEDGDIYCLGSGQEGFEKITDEGKSPLERGGPMRGIRYIGSSVYAVGMKRQIYRRVDFDHWVSIDVGIFSNKSEVVGFEAIDGFDDNDLYAAGWEGEIWGFDGERWERKDSPTNIILHDICCADDGSVYACGQLGTLVKGRGDVWEIIDTELQENLWSLAWFNGTLYLAAFSGIYQLIGDQVRRINFTQDIPGTFYHLSAADGLLCSIGGKDVMGFDGELWFRIK